MNATGENPLPFFGSRLDSRTTRPIFDYETYQDICLSLEKSASDIVFDKVNQIPLVVEEIDSRFKKLFPILKEIFINVGKDRVSIFDWLLEQKKHERNNPDFSNFLENGYIVRSGLIFQLPCNEIGIFLKTAPAILASGNVDKFLKRINEYLELSRRNLVFAIAGLSVGGEIMNAISMTFPLVYEFKGADPKKWNFFNEERVNIPPEHMGQPKTKLRKEQVHQHNPYSWFSSYEDGVTKENVDTFIEGACLVFDESDSLQSKITLRLKAREMRIPVLMITDVGGRVICDFRDFKNDSNIDLFSTISDEKLFEMLHNLNNTENEFEKKMMFVEIAKAVTGESLISDDFKSDLEEFGKGNLPFIPQPPETVAKACEIAVFFTKKYLAGDLHSGVTYYRVEPSAI